jgi:hypothetical protein
MHLEGRRVRGSPREIRPLKPEAGAEETAHSEIRKYPQIEHEFDPRTRRDETGITVVSINIWTFFVALTARPVIAQGAAPKAQTLGMGESFLFIKPCKGGLM